MSFIYQIDFIIAFFFFGALASWIKSDLKIPESASQFLSIFLLLSLGLKGGFQFQSTEDLTPLIPLLILGFGSCLVIPLVLFYLTQSKLNPANAAALAASYGSVSAVTFIAAFNVMPTHGLTASGFMVAVMALMEVPAIILSIFLYQSKINRNSKQVLPILKMVFTSKSVVLLLGGFILGALMPGKTWNEISFVIQDCFKAALVFFLMDLGIQAQKEMRSVWQYRLPAVGLACFAPLVFGSLTLYLAIKMTVGMADSIILAVLAGSASYIAAPAAVRAAIPQAQAAWYMTLPLALTFPMNMIFGIPFYIQLAKWLTNS